MTVLLLHEQVAVHLDCYRSKVSTGPWFCELCDDLLTSRLPGVLVCGLCGDRNGAFRKSTNGQWVHAFCAEVRLLFTDAFFLAFVSLSLPVSLSVLFCSFYLNLFFRLFFPSFGRKSFIYFYVWGGGGWVGWSFLISSSSVFSGVVDI